MATGGAAKGGVVRWLTLLGCALLSASAAPASSLDGRVVAGTESSDLLPPFAADVRPYENVGYRLELRGPVVRIEVEATPLRSEAPFVQPEAVGQVDDIGHLARSLTVGARTVYVASSRILAWVARNVAYQLDRNVPQDAEAVLARRSGYCTGIARLTVALLTSAGIESREVPGWVAAGDALLPQGYHRWVELRLPDRGWVFSDPLRSHHFVPATYLRLASETLELSKQKGRAGAGEQVARRAGLEIVDESLLGGPGVLVRGNDHRQRAAAVKVVAAPGSRGWAVLDGGGVRRSAPLFDGTAVFVGLAPATYRLSVTGSDPKGASFVATAEAVAVSAAVRREIRLVGETPQAD